MRLGVTLMLVFLFLAVGFLSVRAVGFYHKFRGKRIVTCPETMALATVDIAIGRAALETFLGQPQLRVIHCSNWPENQTCSQLCRFQMDTECNSTPPELCD